MKKRIQNAVLIVLVFCLAFLYAHIAKCHNIYDADIDASDHLTISCYDHGAVTQSFVSVEDELDGVRVKCRLTGDVENAKVEFVLKEAESGKEAARGSVPGESLQNGKFARFEFDTISGCKGKTYELQLNTEGETEGNLIHFCYQTSTEENTSMQADGTQKEGTLILKMVTNRFDLETFCVLLIFVAYIVAFMKFLYGLFR